MLKVSELFGYGDFDELVERDAFLFREVFRYSEHRCLEPKWELVHGNLLFVSWNKFSAPLPEFAQQFNGSRRVHRKRFQHKSRPTQNTGFSASL
jgi:hypothetical protein